MEADIFKDIIVPVIGGLGIFMLGLEFMSNGIQSLAVNKMRAVLAKVAGTPDHRPARRHPDHRRHPVEHRDDGHGGRPGQCRRPGAAAGDQRHHGRQYRHHAGNSADRAAAGPLGLLFAGIFALIYVFGKKERGPQHRARLLGFALIFYGLNMMTGGLKPLRNMPEVMAVICGAARPTAISASSIAC